MWVSLKPRRHRPEPAPADDRSPGPMPAGENVAGIPAPAVYPLREQGSAGEIAAVPGHPRP